MTQPQIDALLQSLGAIDTWFEGVSSGDVVPCGTVTWRRKESDEGGDDESPSLEADFEDFSPFPFDDLPEGGSTQFDQKVYATASVDGGFDGALDLFFASFEARRDRSQREKSANAAAKKLEKVKRDQEARVRALEKERQTQELAATLIEYNLTQVDAVLAAVNGALGGGMAWEDLTLMIKEEARAGNPVAGLVKTLDLPNNKVTVTLKNHLDVDTHDDDDEATTPRQACSTTRRRDPAMRPSRISPNANRRGTGVYRSNSIWRWALTRTLANISIARRNTTRNTARRWRRTNARSPRRRRRHGMRGYVWRTREPAVVSPGLGSRSGLRSFTGS